MYRQVVMNTTITLALVIPTWGHTQIINPMMMNPQMNPMMGMGMQSQIFMPQGNGFMPGSIYPPGVFPSSGQVPPSPIFPGQGQAGFMGGGGLPSVPPSGQPGMPGIPGWGPVMPAFNPMFSGRIAAEQAQRIAVATLNYTMQSRRTAASQQNQACAASVPMGALPPLQSMMRLSEIRNATALGVVASVCSMAMSPFIPQNPYGFPNTAMSSPTNFAQFANPQMAPQMAIDQQKMALQSQFNNLEQQKLDIARQDQQQKITEAEQKASQMQQQGMMDLAGNMARMMAQMQIAKYGGSMGGTYSPVGHGDRGDYLGGDRRYDDRYDDDHRGHGH